MRRDIVISILIGLTWLSCAPQSTYKIEPGVTTVQELQQQLGQPESTNVPKARPEAKLMDFRQQDARAVQVQVEGEKVVGINREPEPHERTLQYWRHRWKGAEQRYEPVPGSMNAHGTPLFQLVATSHKMAIVYDSTNDRVVRVVRYAAK
jgi:hypothetical protein